MMSRPMRRNNRAIGTEEAYQILRKGEYGVLSTVDEEGQPYGVPLNYCVLGNCVYFHCAKEGHKIANLEFNARASFCVVGDTELLPEKFSTKYESVIVFGEVREATGDEKHSVLEALVKKYSPAFYSEGMKYIHSSVAQTRVFGIAMDSVSGKARKKK